MVAANKHFADLGVLLQKLHSVMTEAEMVRTTYHSLTLVRIEITVLSMK
jgi:hypothetical protein